MNQSTNTSSNLGSGTGNTAPTLNTTTGSFDSQTFAVDTNSKSTSNADAGVTSYSLNSSNNALNAGNSVPFVDSNSGSVNVYESAMISSDNAISSSIGNSGPTQMNMINNSSDMNFFNSQQQQATANFNYTPQQKPLSTGTPGINTCSSNGANSGSNSSCANPTNSTPNLNLNPNSNPNLVPPNSNLMGGANMNLNIGALSNSCLVNTNNDIAQQPNVMGGGLPQQQNLAEKIQMVAMQMSQLKGQIAAGQASMNPQNKELVAQMSTHLNKLHEVYMQLMNAQQQAAQIRQMSMANNPMMGMNNPNMNMVAAMQAQQAQQQHSQQMMEQQQKQTNLNNIRAMQALQQRMMAIQMMNNQRMKMQFINNMSGQIPPYMLQQQSAVNQQNMFRMLSPKQQQQLQPNMMMNNAANQSQFNPNFQQHMYAMNQMQNMPNMMGMVNVNPGAAAVMGRIPPYHHNMTLLPQGGLGGMNVGGGGGRASLPTTGRRRRKRSDSESSEFSSSPEPTRKEIDELANMTGPLRRSTRAKKPKNYAFDFDFEDEDEGGDKIKNEEGAEHPNNDSANVASGNDRSGGAPELIPVQMTHINDNNVAVIDKILADRIRTAKPKQDSVDHSFDKSVETKPSAAAAAALASTDITAVTTEGVGEEEFYIKYKYYSYLHCEWLTLEEMKLKDRLAINKVKRYKQRKSENIWQFTMEDEYFNPDYVEVDRILAKTVTDYIPDPKAEDEPYKAESTVAHTSKVESFGSFGAGGVNFEKTEDQVVKMEQSNATQTATSKKESPIVITHYLIKWCSLPYEDSTWEPEDLIDDDVIQEYEEREKSLTSERSNFIQRPNMTTWRELPASPIYKENNSLREYQLEGLNWLRFCYYRWQNCILADEMGLGKTIQSIAFVHDVYNLGIRGPFLIIAPLSTIHNWYREFKTWTDLNVIMFHGTAHSRNIIHKYELFYYDKNGHVVPEVYKFDALITTYEMILSELKFLSSVRWRVAVVDEAHRLKNKKCKLLESLSFLQIEHRVLLTGTPLQNSLEELYSLLSFLDPQNIPSEQAFMEEFGNLQSNDQVAKLQRVLKPIMLRRLKEDVEKNIAPKEETIIEVEMTSIQRRIYKSILEKNFSFLAKGTSTSNMPNLMNTMMELRKCCNHPFLIKGCEEKITSDFYSHSNDDMAAYHLRSLIESSGKLVLVDKLLPKLKANGHRVLLFSQMVKVLDIIEDYLLQKKYLYERIDGSIRGNLRQAAIDRFSRPDSDRFIFLLCTKAGGLGINLTAADTVIIFDSDWNPQNDIQAQARCHRIGQSKSVKVYRLICRNSYEREMFDRASLKLGLDKAVLQSINNSNANSEGAAASDQHVAPVAAKTNEKQQLSKQDIEDLLKRGAYGALMDEDTAESAQFCAEDIDQILERRATVVQIAGEGQGSTFAKASFQANKKDDIDVDDPLFWEKWAQKAKLSLNKSNDLVYDTPRERKVINYDDADSYHTDMDSDLDHEDYDHHSTRSTLISSTRTSWLRVECFKVEKQLLIFGWGRWEVVTLYANFKTLVAYDDVLQIARCILAYCWHHAKVDASTKNFIEAIIKNSLAKGANSKNDDNDDYNYKPYVKTRSSRRQSSKRSKRAAKEKQPPCALEVSSDWKDCDPDLFILDPGYRKHLQHNANKILLRIRLLYVLQNEIIGKTDDLIMSGGRADDIQLMVTLPKFTDNSSLASWWNEQCDKSLLIGTYKHGYEKYKEMLLDTQLVFHELIPEEKLVHFIKQQEEQLEAQLNKQPLPAVTSNPDEGPKRRGRKRKRVSVATKYPQPKRNTRTAKEKDRDAAGGSVVVIDNNTSGVNAVPGDMSDFNSDDDRVTTQEVDEDILIDRDGSNPPVCTQVEDDSATVASPAAAAMDVSDEWPSACYLNTRFRRLVTSFWKSKNAGDPSEKSSKKQKSRSSTNTTPASYSGGPVSMYDIKLNKKEENEIYKTLVQFGLEFDYDAYSGLVGSDQPNNAIFTSELQFKWDHIRCFKPFEKRTDEQLTMFAKYLIFSCAYVLHSLNELNPTSTAVALNPHSIFSFSVCNLPDDFKPMDGITAEKAIKLLNRVDLLEVLRQRVLCRDDITEKLYLLPTDSLTTSDMPTWWVSGSHDYMLLKIVERYGLASCDRQIFFDTDYDLYNILLDAFDKARDTQWGGFLDQYSSVNDLTYDMICSIVKWPKQRSILSRIHKLLHFVGTGVWPSKASDCEERYRQIAKPPASASVPMAMTPKSQIADILNDSVSQAGVSTVIAPHQHTATVVDSDKKATEKVANSEVNVSRQNPLQEATSTDANGSITSRQCF